MSLKLSAEDRRAVDLLMDRMAVAAKSNGTAIYAGAETSIRSRVKNVERLLQFLDAMKTPEPPRDLVSRTLEYVGAPEQRRARQHASTAPSVSHPLA